MTSFLLLKHIAPLTLNLHMNSKFIYQTAFALLTMTFAANAGTVPFDVFNYNYPLDGGGGGATATLGGVPVEIYCDDFNNDINAPSNNSAYVTTLSTNANLIDTRFGEVASNAWTNMTSLGNTDDAFFNSGARTSGLARYEMVAYLVSLYNQGQGNNTSNNQIQEAIWTIMDPKAEGAVIDPSGVNASSYLEQAVTWYTSMNANQSSLNSFLSKFEIVSAANMTFSHGLGIGGFQEQIVMTPEPRGGIWILLALALGGCLLWRRGPKTVETAVGA